MNPAPGRRRPHATPARQDRALADAAREATFAFLGRFEVCGVGVAREPQPRIVFLLRRRSPEAEAIITRWASERGASIALTVARNDS